MIAPDPESTFRGLPLTPEQNAEVMHYIKVRTQRGLPWDTPELEAMIRDMMLPPGTKHGPSPNARCRRSKTKWIRSRRARSGERRWKRKT